MGLFLLVATVYRLSIERQLQPSQAIQPHTNLLTEIEIASRAIPKTLDQGRTAQVT